eukprot:CAMPEP_0194320030 /NCGR_PEP_ID=MMETSP0171-20130528/16425_1 /TAXON_ID=218684 /ORGANISM="Corethron pennatum, Strain L29A3" /LENGTH=50 /DNA_ID=CAMNT_0039077449 /DNA_START=652 /DNA_END=801 /DNA_ORIENTATION=+
MGMVRLGDVFHAAGVHGRNRAEETDLRILPFSLVVSFGTLTLELRGTTMR